MRQAHPALGASRTQTPTRIWACEEDCRVYPTVPYEQAVGYYDDAQSGFGCREHNLEVAARWAAEYWQADILLNEWNKGKRATINTHWWSLYEVLLPASKVVRSQVISERWMKTATARRVEATNARYEALTR